jgi:polar amino acid transport system substrate-binding protein
MRHFSNFLIICLTLYLNSCSNKETEFTKLSMLEGGKTFAVPTGTVADKFVFQRFPDAKIKYFNSVLDCAIAVKGGKADAAIYDKPVLQNIAAKNEGLTVLTELLIDDKYGFAVQLNNTELKTAIDQTLAELKSNGTYNDMLKRWFPERGNPAPMPKIELTGKNGVLRFGTAAISEPMSFVDGNRNLVGFDVELASYVARKQEKKLEVTDMEFGAIIPALIAGKVDMIGAGLSITEERATKVLFSESYYPSGIAAAVRSIKPDLSSSTIKLRGAEDIKDKRIGVLLGSMHDAYATKNYPDARIMQFQNVPDMLMALNMEKIDAAFYDQVSLTEVLNSNKELGLLARNVFSVPIAAGINKQNEQLRNHFNTFLKEIKSNGIYDDMVDRWMTRGLSQMPEMPKGNVNGTLRVGVVSDLGMPFTILKDGNLEGFDIELSNRFAAFEGKKFVPVNLQFGSMLASLITNKIDLITCSLMVTEERKKQIIFSDPYFESGVSIIARKKNIEQQSTGTMSNVEDLADKRIGIFTGTVYDGFISKKYPDAQIFRFEGTADLILSVSSGKIDAAMFDLITARIILKKIPELGLLTDDVLTLPLGVGFNKKEPALRDEFNNFLKEIRQDGTYDIMHKRWLLDDPEAAVMPPFKNPSSGKKLIVAVSVDDLPYVAVMNGEYVGLDIEMLRYFAERKNYNLEFVTMEFASLVAALSSGKADMISDGIAITKERGNQIDFSDSYADFSTGVVALKTRIAKYAVEKNNTIKLTFWTKISNSFYSNIIREKRYLLIIKGLTLTVIISVFAALVGTLLGGLVCFMRMSKRKLLSSVAKIYVSLLRGTPVLVLLMIIYYIVFASVNINPAFVAVLAFGLNFAAYVSEMFRTSIESIDVGQKEAGIAGGFTKIQTFIYIIMPQALRRVFPVYKGEFISLVKMTSVVGYIAVQDLTKASDIIRSRTFDAFFPLIMAAVVYLLISWVLTWALGYIEVSVDPKRKRIKRAVEVN